MKMESEATSTSTFTSSVLPSKPGLKGSLSLPVGFILNNLAKMDEIERVPADEMNMCLTCGSFMNTYTPIDESGKWTCSICYAPNPAPPGISSSKVFSAPTVEYHQVAAHNAPNNNLDGQLPNGEHSEDPTVIAIDANIPPKEVSALLKYLSALKLDNVALMIFSNMMHVYQIGLKGIASADIYSPTLDPEESGLESDERMYFGSFEEVEYCANVFFGTSGLLSPTDPDHMLQPLTMNQQQTMSRTEMLRKKREARMKKNTIMKRFDGFDPNAAAQFIKAFRSDQEHTSQRDGSRCTGEAAQYALHLLNGTKSKTGRILIFTNGCCNVGKGSIVTEASFGNDILDPEQAQNSASFMHSVGESAFNSGVGIDVFCGGNITLGASSLLALVKPSGGYVLSHSSFEDADCYHNISFVCQETHVSRAITDKRDADVVGLRMADAHAMNSLNGVIVDLRMPRFFTPTFYHGPGVVLKDERSPCPNERSVLARCASLAAKHGLPTNNLASVATTESTMTRIQMGRYDPFSNISILMQVEKKIPDNYDRVCFQFVSRYIDAKDHMKLITRVTSHMIAVSDDNSTYLESLNTDLITTLIAKEAAFRAMTSKVDEEDRFAFVLDAPEADACALDAQRDIDATIKMISTSYRSHAKSSDTVIAGTDLAANVPPRIVAALERLHNFRRGSILGTNHQSLDDRLLARQIFLRSPLRESIQMIMPSAWRCGVDENGEMEFTSVPTETLSLWDENVLVVDTFDYLFIWSGKSTLHHTFDPLRKACLSFLLERSKFRFPSPKLHVLMEGNPMSRKLTTRFVPSHGDPPQEQIARYPDLKMLDAGSIESLRAKFRFYDPECDPTFRDWSSKVINVTSGGKTLCC